MKQFIFLSYIILVVPLICKSQTPNHSTRFDIDKDGKMETILFFDDYNSEYEKDEFTQIRIINDEKTLYLTDIEVCVPKETMYKKADIDIDNRIGILYENGKIYLWLTGYQYGCCLNETIIAEYTDSDIKPIMKKNFDFSSIQTRNSKRYFYGITFMGESTRRHSDFEIYSYQPAEFLLISDSMRLDEELSKIEALESFKTIEQNIDPYSAKILVFNSQKEDFLLSYEKAEELENREYGIISVIQLSDEYFSNFSKKELQIIRNELYAYKGYRFSNQDLIDYFSKKDWYYPKTISADSIYNSFSDIERYNINIIKNLEE